jgi:hypothetical protein
LAFFFYVLYSHGAENFKTSPLSCVAGATFTVLSTAYGSVCFDFFFNLLSSNGAPNVWQERPLRSFPPHTGVCVLGFFFYVLSSNGAVLLFLVVACSTSTPPLNKKNTKSCPVINGPRSFFKTFKTQCTNPIHSINTRNVFFKSN